MIRTPWGYRVDGALPPLMSVEEFTIATGGALMADPARLEWALQAASAVVRDFCGWHVAPLVECSADLTQTGRLVKLPTMAVEVINSVTVNGEEAAYEWVESGLLRLSSHMCGRSWRGVHVEWAAGVDMAGALATVVSQLASNALAAAPGVREEHAGQVGISYNQTGNGVSGGVRLLESDKAILDAYRIVEV